VTIDLRDLEIVSDSLGRGHTTDSVFVCLNPNVAIFKRYKEGIVQQVDWAVIEELIKVGRSLRDSGNSDDSLAWQACAWPTDIVTDRGRRAGILERWHDHANWLNSVVDSALHSGNALAGPPCGCRTPWVLLVQAMFSKDEDVPPYFDFPAKLQRLGEILSLVRNLHQRGVCVGDLNPRNIQVAPPGSRCPESTAIYIIDVDSFWVNGVSANPDGPSLSRHQTARLGTPESDNQKLGDLFYQLMLQNQGANAVSARDGLDRAVCGRLIPVSQVDQIDALVSGQCALPTLSRIALQWQCLERFDGAMSRALPNNRFNPYSPGEIVSVEKSLGPQQDLAPTSVVSPVPVFPTPIRPEQTSSVTPNPSGRAAPAPVSQVAGKSGKVIAIALVVIVIVFLLLALGAVITLVFGWLTGG